MHAPLIIDIAGTRLTEADRARLAHPLVGGVILFSRNASNRTQLTRLCVQIKRVRRDLLIAVDHEGGRVQRFRFDGMTHLPAMRELGRRWRQAPEVRPGEAALAACNAASAAGYVLAAELRACGVDLSFAPVLDLDHGRSEVIGDRAFDADARVVTLLAQSLMHGMRQAGMAHCGKHFPGHGWAEADSHVDLPVDDRPLDAILADDAAPYGWLSASLVAVMPAHVLYPQVDARPAGFSAVWLRDVLRQRLGFTGAVFSDDLSMAGARVLDGRTLSYAEAALAALQAGCDMVLLCNQSLVDGGAAIDELIEGLARAYYEGHWTPDDAAEARRRALLPSAAAMPWDALMTDARYQHALELLP
ncbi:MAG: beta-N-acetylhexosaminidase [Tepidimonas ignava]|uniref:beta-N-acetylhexosaminidase n=1 Tax=Tepidimonas ignava TaxID=114249 RepID=UPI002A357A66|nr:beta-N-acetylhexosaminidase [Tepidimonas ignava]